MPTTNTPTANTPPRTTRFSRRVAAADNIANATAQAAAAMPLRFSLLTIFILQPLVILLFQPSYDTNDDVFMTMIASGKGICPAPDEHLVFTNILVGQVLKPLYTVFPGFPWYGFYLHLAHFAAQVTILYCALVIGRNSERQSFTSERYVWPRLGLYLLYFAIVELAFLNRMQYTTTAFVTAQAGIFALLLAWNRRVQHHDARVIGPLLAATALLVAASIIRLESLVMALLVSAPLMLMLLRDFSFRAFAPCGIAMATALALVAAAIAFDHRCYESDPAWRGFRAFNQLRGTFHDNNWTSYTPQTAHIFSHLGWSRNDHAMIERWFSDDPSTYSRAKMTAIVNAYPWRSARDNVELALHTLKRTLPNRSIVAVLLALPYAILVVRGGKRTRWAILGSVMAAVALIVVITLLKKVPPERVTFPLLSFPLAAALMTFAWRCEKTSPDASSSNDPYLKWLWSRSTWLSQPVGVRVILALMVVAIVMGVYRQARRSVHVARDRVALRKFLAELRPANEKLYVTWEPALPYELVSPLDSLDAWSQASFLSLSWNQGTPWNEAIKQRYNIDHLPRAIYERDDIELVASPDCHQLFTTFAKEHFGGDVELVSRFANKRFIAGRFRQKHSDAETTANSADSLRR